MSTATIEPNLRHATVTLITAPKTRAERFYLENGWRPVGTSPHGEVIFQKSFPEAPPRAR